MTRHCVISAHPSLGNISLLGVAVYTCLYTWTPHRALGIKTEGLMNWIGERIQFLTIRLLSGWWVQAASATATADIAGFEPAASHCADIVVDVGALPFKSYMSRDSFPDYRSANQAEGGQMPFADRGGSAGFGVAQTPTVREEGTRRSRLHIGDKLALTLRSYRRSILGTVFQFHRKTGTSSYPYTPCFCMACMTRVFTPFPPQVAAVEKS